LNRQPDHEAQWGALSRAWREREESPRVDPAALAMAVSKETHRMRRWLVHEVALSVVVAVFAIWYALRASGERALFVPLDTLAVLIIVWAFALWGRRNLWAPAAQTSRAYVGLARRRARLKWLTAWLAVALVAAQLVVSARIGLHISSVQLLAAGAWVGWAVWIGRRSRRELRYYDELMRSLE
jgi:hypothetical protein